MKSERKECQGIGEHRKGDGSEEKLYALKSGPAFVSDNLNKWKTWKGPVKFKIRQS